MIARTTTISILVLTHHNTSMLHEHEGQHGGLPPSTRFWLIPFSRLPMRCEPGPQVGSPAARPTRGCIGPQSRPSRCNRPSDRAPGLGTYSTTESLQCARGAIDRQSGISGNLLINRPNTRTVTASEISGSSPERSGTCSGVPKHVFRHVTDHRCGDPGHLGALEDQIPLECPCRIYRLIT